MNGLSLRVSKARINEGIVKSNAELRMEVVKIVEIEAGKDFPVVIQEFLRAFSEAQTVEEQLRLIKKEAGNVELLQIFTEIYFSAPIKHPVRQSLVKIIDQSTAQRKECVEFLANKIKECLDNPDSESNHLICSLGGCLERFECGLEAFRTLLEDILRATTRITSRYVDNLSAEISPAEKNELYLCIHNVTRMVIASLQQFPDSSSHIDHLTSIGWALMDLPDLPSDTKSNFGVMIAMKAKIDGRFDLHLAEIAAQNPLKRLHLAIGVISILDSSQVSENPTILYKLAQIIAEIGQENCLESSFILCVCRAFVQLSKKMRISGDLASLDRDSLQKTAEICLNHGLIHLDHYMDSVKHLSRELIKNVSTFGAKALPEVNEKLFREITGSNLNKVVKSVLISCLCQTLGADKVVQEVPNVREYLLMALENTNSNNINCTITTSYEFLMTSGSKGTCLDDWFRFYIQPLLNELKSLHDDKFELKRSLKGLIIKAVKRKPEVAIKINESDAEMNLKLACLSEVKKSGKFDNSESSEELWKGVLAFKDIQKAMTSSCDETRTSALALIAEAHKSTEIFTSKELECVLYFLRYNVNAQNPATRQQMLALMKNLLIRLKNTTPGVRKIGKAGDYFTFIRNLFDFCVGNFFPGANFSRRMVSLKILLQLLDIVRAHEIDLELWNAKSVETIFDCLADSYETNKKDALEVLKFCPKERLNEVQISFELAEKLALSTKPADSITAAYYLELLVYLNDSPDAILENLIQLESSLDSGIDLAEANLLEAARQNPLYGVLFCIRHLLDRLDYKKITTNENFAAYFDRLLNKCERLTNVVGPVVNSNSPEGFLPAISLDSPLQTTPQMLLLCAWRTVKEVSLILGEIAFRSPRPLLPAAKILSIGAHFTRLLSETKHRGAFEQAFIGFSRLCLRLWSTSEPELHQLPRQCLESLIRLITGETLTEASAFIDLSVDKLCATRRSAGVPFLIQALVTTELQVGSTKGLKFCMERLIGLCGADEASGEARTHALNIMRALFRCTDLGEAIGEFVAEGVMAAIRGYRAGSWSERNSATLLFSALMVRVFGVQRTKDSENLNIRNRMTGRIFFMRYPKLFDFFLNELQLAQQTIQEGRRSSTLHPLLLLLSRLYPSSYEGTESTLQLTEFLPAASYCSSCGNLKTRVLAAKFVAIIVPPTMIFGHIFFLLQLLDEDMSNVTLNSIHGVYLQIFYLIRAAPLEEKSALVAMWTKLVHVLPSLRQNSILKATFLDIVFEFYHRIGPELLQNFKLMVSELDAEQNSFIGDTLFGHKVTTMRFLCAIANGGDVGHFEELIKYAQKSYENSDALFNLLLLICDSEEAKNQLDELELTEIELKLAQSVSRSQIEAIFDNPSFHQLVLSHTKENAHYLTKIKAFWILSLQKSLIDTFMTGSDPEKVQNLIEFTVEQPDQLKNSTFKCVLRLIETNKNIPTNLEWLQDISSPKVAFELRSTAARVLRSTFHRFIDNRSSDMLLENFLHNSLVLLRDDSVLIREHASETVFRLSSSFFGVEFEGNFIPEVAAEQLLSILVALSPKKSKEILRKILEMDSETQDTEDKDIDQTTSDDIRCFDKNEVNIYAERWQQHQLIQRFLENET